MSTINIFFIGATGKSFCRSFFHSHLTHPGFIGGSILSSLISHRLAKLFSITVLIRSSSKVELFRSLGIRAVVGSNSDLQLLTVEAANADIVYSCADSDDVTAIEAILAGMKLHFERTGKTASLIHTSGTGVLSEDTKGMRATETVYSDLDTALLDTLAPTQPHRPVDLTIFEADEQGYVKTYVVAPGSIYGRARGPLAAMGIQRVHSIHIPVLVELALSRKQAGVFGEGQNVWVNISISDLVDLYTTLFDTILATTLTSVKAPAQFQHGRLGFYFATSDEHKMYQISKKIAEVLHHLGIGDAEPTKFSDEERKQNPIMDKTSVGANSRATSDRAKALGWKPKDTTESMLMTIEEEVKAALK
ncbi:NAD(P)-binding protein [Hymenopellis radicata]|nr:NAD(P)-binding protein [Hymenopellis radicata]